MHQSNTATLAGTSPEFRAGLLRFDSRLPGGCAARSADAVPCGRSAPWSVVCEDAHAGVTVGDVFSPAIVITALCDMHLEQLRGEPRRVMDVERRSDPNARAGNVAIIRLPDGWPPEVWS